MSITPKPDTPTDAQKASLDKVVAWLASKNKIDPTTLKDTIKGHRQVASTDCPGDNLMNYLPTLSTHVAALMK